MAPVYPGPRRASRITASAHRNHHHQAQQNQQLHQQQQQLKEQPSCSNQPTQRPENLDGMCDEEIFFDWEDGSLSPRSSVGCPADGLSMITVETAGKIASLHAKHDPPVVAKLRHQIQALRLAHPTGCFTAADIASTLTMLGVTCRLRSSVVEKGPGGNCLKQLRYCFVVVEVYGGPEVYVDPQFQEQFLLARNDPRHDAFVSSLPSTFVGTEASLREIVQLAAEHVMAALDRLQLDRPPWRNADALLSKWLPKRYIDETLQAGPFIPSSSCGSLRGSWIGRPRQRPTVVMRRERGGYEVPINAADLKPKCVVQGFPARRVAPVAGSLKRDCSPMPLSPFADEPGPSSTLAQGSIHGSSLISLQSNGLPPVSPEHAARDLALAGMAGLRLNRTSSKDCKGNFDEAFAEVKAERKSEMRKRRTPVLERSPITLHVQRDTPSSSTMPPSQPPARPE